MKPHSPFSLRIIACKETVRGRKTIHDKTFTSKAVAEGKQVYIVLTRNSVWGQRERLRRQV